MAQGNRRTSSASIGKTTNGWLKNAMRSVGISTNDALKGIYPNLYEVSSTGASATKNLVSQIRSGGSVGQVTNSLQSNKYVKFAHDVYKNALSDIKTGNLNNTEREEKAFLGDNDSDYEISYGDEDEERSINLNVSGNEGAIMSLSNHVRKQSESTLKANKASMDAFIAVSSASMFQNQQLGEQIVGQLNNINNNLSAIVEYNNENMTKFIQASMTYYDKMGSSMDDYGSNRNDKMAATKVFAGNNGAINISNYRKYVKEQIKNNPAIAAAGMANDMLSEDNLRMMAANPIGSVSKSLIQYMIPKMIGTTIGSMETTLNNFLPTFLNQMSDWANDYTGSTLKGMPGMMAKAKRFIGGAMGVKVEKASSISAAASIKKGAIPFDGETKHAITEIITKELREQTSYLKAIAEHNHIDTRKARENADVFDYSTGKYMKKSEVSGRLLEELKSSVMDSFAKGAFGKQMRHISDNSSGKAVDELNHGLEEFFYALSQSSEHINPSDRSKNSAYKNILKNMGGSKRTKNEIDRYMQEMQIKNPNAYYDFTRSVMGAQQSMKNKIGEIEEDPGYYNLWASGLNGDEDIYNKIARKFGYKVNNPKREKAAKEKNSFKRAHIDDMNTADSTGLFGGMISRGTQSLSRQMTAIMSGNPKQAVVEYQSMISDQIAALGDAFATKFINPMKSAIFGDKNEKGYTQGGMFQSVQNKMEDMINTIKYGITGKEWTDSKGGTHEATENSVTGNLSRMGSTIKKGVVEKLFGKQGTDENGNPIEDKERTGVFHGIVDSFRKGMEGWQEAFVGHEMTDDERAHLKDTITNQLKEKLPDTLTGGAIGAGVGALAGGSVLGLLVGGPMGGAAFGAAAGFLNKNEKFQKWLFGDTDDDGKRTGGVISKQTQEFFSKNKNFLTGGAAIGSVMGGLGLSHAANGVLGTLVGGPIAGAAMGLGTSMIMKSKTFNRFLFGDEDRGQKGIINAVKDAFNKNNKSVAGIESNDNAKAFGMGVIGAGTGAITAGLLSHMGIIGASLTPMGPVGGALFGLGLSIKAQGNNFKTWLFGEDYTDEKGDKKHKSGVIGQFGNMLNANVFRPVTHEIQFLFKDANRRLANDVLTPFSFVAEGMAGLAGKAVSGIKEHAFELFNEASDSANRTIKDVVGGLFAPLGKTVAKAAHMTGEATLRLVSVPGNIIKLGVNIMQSKIGKITSSIHGFLKEVRKRVFKGLGRLLKYTMDGVGSVLKIATSPLRFVGGLVGTGINKINNKVRNKLEERGLTEFHIGNTDGTFAERWKLARQQSKVDAAALKADRKTWQANDKNAQLIAKGTKNQYSNDTEEARAALRRSNYGLWKKLNTDVRTEDQQSNDAKVKKEGKGTAGLTEKQLAASNLNKLNEEGKQTYFLQGIFNIMRGRKWNGDKKGEGESADSETFTEKAERIKSNHARMMREREINGEVNPNNENEIPEEIAGNDSFKAYIAGVASSIGSFFHGNATTGKKNLGGRALDKLKSEGSFWAHKVLPFKVRSTSDEDEEGGGGGYGDDDAKIADNQKALEQARDRAVTADEKKKEIAESKSKSWKDKLLDSLKKGNKENEKHHSIWNSIFSKKGLITGGLILLAPLIMKLISNVGSMFSWISSIKGLTNGNSIIEEATTQATNLETAGSKLLSGNVAGAASSFVYDENGDVTSQSGARARGVAKTGFKVANKAISGGTKIAKVGSKVAKTKVGSALIKAGKNVGSSAIKSAASGKAGKVAKIIKDAMKSFLSKITTGLSKKGIKIGKTVGKEVIEDATQVAVENSGKIAGKITATSVGKAAAAVASLGASEVTWIALGALNGLTGAAKLFHVDKKYVDTKMTLIAGFAGGVAGSTVGTIIDIVNELVASITGVDFVSALCTEIYKAISSDDKDAKLTEGQNAFKTKYTNYQSSKIKSAYNTAIKSGSIDSSVTYEEYQAGVKSGKYEVKYKSFQDYNESQHKTLAGKIGTGVHNLFSGKTFSSISNNLKKKTKTNTCYVDSEGCYYMYNGAGYDYYSSNGSKIDENIPEDDVTAKVKAGTVYRVSKSNIKFSQSASAAIKKLKSSKLGEAFSKSVNYKIASVKAFYKTTKSVLKKITSNLFGTDKSSKQKNAKVYIDTSGCYYELKGSTYTKYNVNGDVVETDIKKAYVRSLLEYGMLTEGTKPKSTNAKATAKTLQQKAADTWSSIWSTVKSAAGSIGSFLTGGSGAALSGGFGGGYGESDTMNGFKYYSQNDPRWGSKSYSMGADSATMGSSGCGPSAMSMVASQMTGSDISPTAMAGLAQTTGDRDATGTNWNFIDKASSLYGIPTTENYAPSKDFINSQLDQGKPMILSGASGGGMGGGRSAYTSAGHYVVAVGKDNNGNVLINDPRGKSYSGKYNLNDVANQTNAAWSFGGGGFGSKSTVLTDSGTRNTKSTSSNNVDAKTVVALANNEVGYLEKKTNTSLNDKTANAGSGNYTKYGDVVGANGQFWCASFVSWVFYTAANNDRAKAGKLLCGNMSASAEAIRSQFQTAGQYSKTPQVGDCIFFSGTRHSGANHIGIVTAVSNNKVSTVEGNTTGGNDVIDNGGSVAKKSYDIDNTKILGYGHPPYNGTSDYSGDVSSSSSDSSSASMDTSNIFSAITSFMSEAGSRALSGALTGNFNSDYSSLINGSSSTDSSDSSTTSADGITGSNTAQKVWNYFQKAGYSKAATAGILGNMHQESGVDPTAIQGKGKGPAAGIVQWENYTSKSGRWKKMSDYASSKGKGWTDLGSQLEYVDKELKGLNSYFKKNGNTTYDTWKQSTDVNKATEQFETAFERAGKPNMSARYTAANKYYSLYGGGSGGGMGNAPMISRLSTSNLNPVVRGGSGHGINYGSTNNYMTREYQNQYSSARQANRKVNGYGGGYGSTSSDMKSVITLLAQIANNTLDSNGKLDLLKTLSNGSSNNTNIITTGSTKSGGSGNGSTTNSNTSTSKQFKTASRIALG